MICLIMLFLIYGLISGNDYTFDLNTYVLGYILTAFVCGLIASIKRVEI